MAGHQTHPNPVTRLSVLRKKKLSVLTESFHLLSNPLGPKQHRVWWDPLLAPGHKLDLGNRLPTLQENAEFLAECLL